MSPLEILGLSLRGVIGAGLALWVYTDVRRQERSLLWSLGTFLIPEAFFPLYFWNQAPELSWICPRCHQHNRAVSRRCRQCEQIYTAEETTGRLHGYFESSDAIVILLIALLIQDFAYNLGILMAEGGDALMDGRERLTPSVSQFWIVKLIIGNVLIWLCIHCITGRYRRPLPSVGVRYNANFSTIGLSFLLAGALALISISFRQGLDLLNGLAVSDWLSSLIKWEHQQHLIGIPQSWNIGSVILLGFVGVVLLPVGEEILFRGISLIALSDQFGRQKGILLSALLFAAVHGLFRYVTPLILETVPLFLMGLVLARLFVRTKSLIPGMVTHGLVNLISLLVWHGNGA